ncbi:hypothetical protein H0H87_007190 [Tephrocybe sp. NHM501043]|nr:hypothetical protein H0H87_007190 [Tephrocybe sp. NHM501043]
MYLDTETQDWTNTIAQDPLVPDPYSNTNAAEDFAQNANIAMFDKIVPGGFASVEPDWDGVYNQYSTVQLKLGYNLLPGGTCFRRWSDSDIVEVPATVSKRAASNRGRKPTYMPHKSIDSGHDPTIVHDKKPTMRIIRDRH